jgi:ATP-dependent RNA helicase RhlE
LTNFADFGLAAPIQKALVALGYETPTPIQVKAIPHVMDGHDLLGIAQTGTGKTAAFALPTLHRLSSQVKPTPPRGCRALVLSPTRELASQIAESFRDYGKHLRLSSAVIFGSVSLGKQEQIMRAGVDILVATPGRLLDLIDRRAMSLRDIEVLVLDEADQMLDLGFIHALRRIVTMVPKQRQSLFFSATMPKSIADLAGSLLKDPVRVEVAPVATTAERVEQQVVFVSQARKQALLIERLKDRDITRTLVFTRTKHGADKVVKALSAAAINAAAIHGNKSQSQRERALADFKSGRCRVLVATDIAARGIDIDAVSHVFNFELPNVPEQYVHRIGRTARAGADGIAISFCNAEERAYLRDIEKLTRMEIPRAAAPEGFDLGRDEGPSEAPRGGRGRNGGGRPQPQGRAPRRHDEPRRDARPQGGHRSEAPRGEWRPETRADASADVRRDDRQQRERPRPDGPRLERLRDGQPPRAAHQPQEGCRPEGRAAHPRAALGARGDSRQDPRADRRQDKAEGNQRIAWLDRPRQPKQNGSGRGGQAALPRPQR